MLMPRIAAIVWPAFLVACPAEAIFFTLFDPADLRLFGEALEASPLAVYSLGFLAFWAMGAVSSLLTVLLQPARRDSHP